jgi:hypothetical protein
MREHEAGEPRRPACLKLVEERASDTSRIWFLKTADSALMGATLVEMGRRNDD